MNWICRLVLPVLIGSAAQAQSSGAPSLLAPKVAPIRSDRYALPPVHDYGRLGVFCKLDVQLEKHLPLPVRFRLGDPMLVDAWEGKGPLGTLRTKH